MKKEIADKWVEALRSGKYKQAKQRLHRDDAFCCLGVLCDISELSEWKYSYYFDHHCNLPYQVMDWAEMRSYNGIFENNVVSSLANLNDNGKSFNEIADIIEKHWEEL